MSSVSTFAQAKTSRTSIDSKPLEVEVQCNDWGWTAFGRHSVGWPNYCSTLSARVGGTITDTVRVKADCDDSTSRAVYQVIEANTPKFQFEKCDRSINNSNPYSQSR